MKSCGILVILLSLAGAASLAQTADQATKSKIAALEQLWNQAYKSADTKALDSILDDAIVLVNDDGSVQTKAEFLASVKSSAGTTPARLPRTADAVPIREKVRSPAGEPRSSRSYPST